VRGAGAAARFPERALDDLRCQGRGGCAALPYLPLAGETVFFGFVAFVLSYSKAVFDSCSLLVLVLSISSAAFVSFK
jgi:hypothetical protein